MNRDESSSEAEAIRCIVLAAHGAKMEILVYFNDAW